MDNDTNIDNRISKDLNCHITRIKEGQEGKITVDTNQCDGDKDMGSTIKNTKTIWRKGNGQQDIRGYTCCEKYNERKVTK